MINIITIIYAALLSCIQMPAWKTLYKWSLLWLINYDSSRCIRWCRWRGPAPGCSSGSRRLWAPHPSAGGLTPGQSSYAETARSPAPSERPQTKAPDLNAFYSSARTTPTQPWPHTPVHDTHLNSTSNIFLCFSIECVWLYTWFVFVCTVFCGAVGV